MNRRQLATAIPASLIAAGFAPYPILAQDEDVPAEVTLAEPSDDDAVWVAGGTAAVAGVYTIYANGTVTARSVGEDYRAVLDEPSPTRSFSRLIEMVGKD